MHLIVAGDAYPEYHANFVKWVRGRNYPENKYPNFGIKVREIKLYDISFPKEIEKSFLSDLKYFTKFSSSIFNKAIKFISRFINCNKKLIPVNLDEVTASSSQEVKVPNAPNDFWIYLAIVGKVDDGEEYLQGKMEELL